jgi:hypothetical protein
MQGEMMKITVGVACLCLGLLGGAIGASCVVFVNWVGADRSNTLQVHTLQILDAHNNVRAVLATDESDGSVYLRMQSKNNPAAVNLVVRNDNGTLSFNTGRTNSLVWVGYGPDGDVVNDRLGLWGITIKGPNHQIRGMYANTVDGVPQGFLPPTWLLPPPTSPSRH